MIIAFGNQKGGAGKTTLCALLANYLSIEKHAPVMVLDMDVQQSLVNLRQRDAAQHQDMPYPIEIMHLTDYAKYRSKLNSTEAFILIDLPGTLNDEGMRSILQDADYIICPFRYDFISVVSTLDFTDVVSVYAPSKTSNREIFYIPNIVKAQVNYDQLQKTNDLLSEKGIVTASIADRISLQRIKTHALTFEQKEIVEATFGFIYNHVQD
jgi:chromosome partitioning protein